MVGALKLGLAGAAAYALGGKLGAWAVDKASPTASLDTKTAAIWGGRIAVFVVAVAVASKV